MNRVWVKFAFMAILFWMTHASFVFSAEPDSNANDLPVYYLGEIVVTTERYQKPPSSVTEISLKDIESQGARNVAQALSLVPGLIVSTGYKNSSEIKIRGFESADILILVDGRPVNLPYYGHLDLSTLPVSNISKIKVIKGPAKTLYGANAMGGVVNIITKRANSKRLGDLTLSLGKNRSYDMSLNFGSKLGKLDYWLSAGKSRSDGFSLPSDFEPTQWEDGEIRENSDYDKNNLDGKMNYRLSNRTDLSLSLGYFQMEKGLPSGTDDPRFWRFKEWKRYYLDFNGEKQFRSGFYLKAKFFYDRCKNRLIDYKDNTYSYSKIYFDSIHDSWDIGGLVISKIAWNEKIESSFGLNVKDDVLNKKPDTDKDWEFYETFTTSFCTEHQLKLTSKMIFEVDLSFNVLTSEGVEKNPKSLNPFVGVSYYPNKSFRLYLSIAKATRFPTLHQLYSSTSGNPDLKPERANKYDLGVEKNFKDWLSFQLNFFRNDLENLIDRKGRGYSYFNQGKATSQGFEIGGSLKMTKNLSLRLDYTYLDAWDNKTGNPLPYNPAHKTSYTLSYLAEFGLSFHLAGLYVSQRDTFDHRSLPSYFVMNVKLSQKLFKGVRSFLEIKNIADQNYEEEEGFPVPGRTFLLGVTLKY